MEAEKFDPTSTVILNPEELRLGMYVSYLDRPWGDSQFPYKGFKIETEKDLQQLRETCEYVFVDPQRGENREGYQDYFEKKTHTATFKRPVEVLLESKDYVDAHPTEKEFRAAKAAHAGFRDAVIKTYEMARNGTLQDLSVIKAASSPLIDSIERMPDALLYLVRTQSTPDYLYSHAVACAVLGAAMGRHMRYARGSLEALTLGCALLDIGKTRAPRELLNRPSALALSTGELHQLRRHVEYSLEIISMADPGNSPLTELVVAHHERHDGSGYPYGIAGNVIPVLGRIAAIIDMFDAMISQKSYGRRATAYEAMRYLKSQRDIDFDGALVNEFAFAFGYYPTGSLVELVTGEVGFVIQQNREAQIQPRVYILMDAKGKRPQEFLTIDLAKRKKGGMIKKCLKSGSYGIDF